MIQRRHITTILAGVVSAWLLSLGAGTARAQDAPRPLVDTTTPRRALKHFIVSCRAGDYEHAAEHLDLSGLEPAARAEGPLLARRLKFVMDQKVWIDWEKVSDKPGGRLEGIPLDEIVGIVPVAEYPVPVALSRHEQGDGAPPRWQINARTVAQIPAMHAEHGPPVWLDERLPDALFTIRFLELEAWQWIGLVLDVLLSWFGGALAAFLLLRVVGSVARRTRATWDDRLVNALRPPLRFFLALVALEWLATPLRLSAPAHDVIDGVRSILFAVTVAWVSVRLVTFVATTLEETLTSGVKDEAQVRGVRTQVLIMRRIASVVVTVVACALILTRFEVVRTIGVSMLASAGIAGIVFGLAAQRPISALLAGIQLSITQPIRIGDTVIVEGEWGWIEEIHLTYVVVKVWDLRRLIVPINKFLETTFQNWTKVSPEIMGTVEVFADYSTPVDLVRAELERICKENARWDQKVCGLQVTAVSPQTVTLRALVSSKDAGTNWDLRCDVREELVEFLQRLDGGRYLPRARVDRAAHGDDAEAPGEEVADDGIPDAALIATAAALDGR